MNFTIYENDVVGPILAGWGDGETAVTVLLCSVGHARQAVRGRRGPSTFADMVEWIEARYRKARALRAKRWRLRGRRVNS